MYEISQDELSPKENCLEKSLNSGNISRILSSCGHSMIFSFLGGLARILSSWEAPPGSSAPGGPLQDLRLPRRKLQNLQLPGWTFQDFNSLGGLFRILSLRLPLQDPKPHGAVLLQGETQWKAPCTLCVAARSTNNFNPACFLPSPSVRGTEVDKRKF